jgi:FdhD protein
MVETYHDGIELRPITRYDSGESSIINDAISVEGALKITVEHRGKVHLFSTTLCTPHDVDDLVAGLLWSEGVILNPSCEVFKNLDINTEKGESNALVPELCEVELSSLGRLQNSTPSCGWCGRTSVDEVMELLAGKTSPTTISLALQDIARMVEKVKLKQSIFSLTGGVHAAALLNRDGEIEYLREDVGRHNAVDKTLGSCLREGRFPVETGILVLSGRAGLELIHKAAMSEIEVVISVGAPTTMAIDVARAANITLIGFVKEDSMNIYTNQQRIRIDE